MMNHNYWHNILIYSRSESPARREILIGCAMFLALYAVMYYA